MRMSAKAEYAVRAMVELATVDDGVLVKTEELAQAVASPPRELVAVRSVLRSDRLVKSPRGRDGGYTLALPHLRVGVAGVVPRHAGSLASVHDTGLGDL